jgi:hypothetical protein
MWFPELDREVELKFPAVRHLTLEQIRRADPAWLLARLFAGTPRASRPKVLSKEMRRAVFAERQMLDEIEKAEAAAKAAREEAERPARERAEKLIAATKALLDASKRVITSAELEELLTPFDDDVQRLFRARWGTEANRQEERHMGYSRVTHRFEAGDVFLEIRKHIEFYPYPHSEGSWIESNINLPDDVRRMLIQALLNSRPLD